MCSSLWSFVFCIFVPTSRHQCPTETNKWNRKKINEWFFFAIFFFIFRFSVLCFWLFLLIFSSVFRSAYFVLVDRFVFPPFCLTYFHVIFNEILIKSSHIRFCFDTPKSNTQYFHLRFGSFDTIFNIFKKTKKTKTKQKFFRLHSSCPCRHWFWLEGISLFDCLC